MMDKKLENIFESVIWENASFIKCFNKLLDNLLTSCDLLEKYCGGDKLIENINIYNESQKALIPIIRNKIESIKFDIKLIKSKTPKSKMPRIDKQNDKIISLTYNILTLNSKFFHERDRDNEAILLQNETMIGFQTLKQSISDYNVKAEKKKSDKLISIDEAQEKVRQMLLTGLNRIEGNL